MIDESSREMQPVFEKEFTVDGITYIYRFGLLKNLQVRLAETVYRTMHQRADKAPGSIAEAFAVGNQNYKIYTLSFLLRRKNADGSIAPFEKPDIMSHEKSAAFAFVENLPASYDSDIEEAIADFFTNAGLYLLKLAVDMSYIGSAMQTNGYAQQLRSTLTQPLENFTSASNSTTPQSSVAG